MALCVQFPEIIEIENAIRYGYSWYDIVERELAKSSAQLNCPARFIEPPTAAECAARRTTTARKLYASVRDEVLDAIRVCSPSERSVDCITTYIAEIARMFPPNLQEEILTDLATVIEEEQLYEIAAAPAPAPPTILYEVPGPEVICTETKMISAPVRRITTAAPRIDLRLERMVCAYALQEKICMQSSNPFDWILPNTVHPTCVAMTAAPAAV